MLLVLLAIATIESALPGAPEVAVVWDERDPPAFALNVPLKGARRAIGRAGYRVRDATTEYAAFHGRSNLMLGLLDAPRPQFWPRELVEYWDRHVLACKQHGSGAPYDGNNDGSAACSRRIAAGFWQRWLEHEKIADVVILETDYDADAKQYRIKGTAYRSSEPTLVSASSGLVTRATFSKTVGSLALKLLKGGGELGRREIVRKLPEPMAGFELQPSPVFDFAAVPVPATCTPPNALEVSEPTWGPVLAARWRKSVAGRKVSPVALGCNLDVALTPENLMGVPVTMANATLTCGRDTWRERWMCVASSDETCQRTGTATLIEKALKSGCRRHR